MATTGAASRYGAHAKRARGDPRSGTIRVAVVEEVEIFRRGLVACLSSDPGLDVTEAAHAPAVDAVDVAVVSGAAASRRRFSCPIVVCAGERDEPAPALSGNAVVGVLDRGKMTEAQLRLTVRAAAEGLRVNADRYAHEAGPERLDHRLQSVLELLADGRSTREIAGSMSYSERTSKKLIHDLEQVLGARSRAQVVAHAMRRGLI